MRYFWLASGCRFRLISLLAAVTLVALFLATVREPLRQRRVATMIRATGGSVGFDYVDIGWRTLPWEWYCWLAGRTPQLPTKITLTGRCTDVDRALQLASELPQLSSLDLTHSSVDDDSFRRLAPLRRVQHLRVQGRPLTDRSMPIVRAWSDLRSASFHGTKITDTGVAQLQHCGGLEELSLRSTLITDASVDTLARLRHLYRLDISRCNLTDDSIALLRNALPKCELDTEDH